MIYLGETIKKLLTLEMINFDFFEYSFKGNYSLN